METSLLLGLFLLVYVLAVVLNKLHLRADKKRRLAALDEAVGGAQFIFHSDQKPTRPATAIAIGTDGISIALASGKQLKSYNRSDVRGGSIIVGGNALDGMQFGAVIGDTGTMLRGALQGIAANKFSGLFIDVVDIENPKWVVYMRKPKDRARWGEIFLQFMEGRLEK